MDVLDKELWKGIRSSAVCVFLIVVPKISSPLFFKSLDIEYLIQMAIAWVKEKWNKIS